MNDASQKQMTEAQQTVLFRYTKLGLEWVSGKISLDDVITELGTPGFHSDQPGKAEYSWFPGKVMSISFIFDRFNATDKNLRIDEFNIEIEDNVLTNIPYECFDELGMHRIVRGEKIDSVRTEQGEFFWPTGVVDASGGFPINYIGFAYRLSLPDGSPYDIRATVSYLAELVSETGPWDLKNVRRAVNLRELRIYRHYLSPDELKQRNDAKRSPHSHPTATN
jgi:hypothetical protein